MRRIVLIPFFLTMLYLLPPELSAADPVQSVAGRSLTEYAQQLSSDNRVVRLRAAKSLGVFGESAGPALLEALQNQDAAVQYIAAEHLGLIGGQPLEQAKPELIRLSDEVSPLPVRMAAAFALCRSGDVKTHLSTLTDALQHRERGVVCSAAALIGKIGPEAETAIEALEKVHAEHRAGVKGGDYHRGGAAMNALRQIRGN